MSKIKKISYRHYIICNMPMNFLKFLIKEKILNKYLNNTIRYHIKIKNKPIETIKHIFGYGETNYMNLSFLWLNNKEKCEYWCKKEDKWLKYIGIRK